MTVNRSGSISLLVIAIAGMLLFVALLIWVGTVEGRLYDASWRIKMLSHKLDVAIIRVELMEKQIAEPVMYEIDFSDLSHEDLGNRVPDDESK